MPTGDVTSVGAATPSIDEMDHDHGVPSADLARKEEALEFLRSLLNKNLRVTTTDGRMFWGAFKCTDPESNIILQYAYEYRQPSARKLAEAAAGANAEGNPASSVKLEMTSRYLGLVVIPGQYIVKMEVEEFASQMKTRS